MRYAMASISTSMRGSTITDPTVADVLTEELLQNAHRDLLELAAMQAELDTAQRRLATTDNVFYRGARSV